MFENIIMPQIKNWDLSGFISPNHTMAHEVWFQEPVSKYRIPLTIHESPHSPMRFQEAIYVADFEAPNSIETCYLMSVHKKYFTRILKDEYKDEKNIIGMILSKCDEGINQPCWPFSYVQIKTIVRNYEIFKFIHDDLKYKLQHCDNWINEFSENMIPLAVKPIDSFQFVIGSKKNQEVAFNIEKEYERLSKQYSYLTGRTL